MLKSLACASFFANLIVVENHLLRLGCDDLNSQILIKLIGHRIDKRYVLSIHISAADKRRFERLSSSARETIL
jgi:hypothetical protein